MGAAVEVFSPPRVAGRKRRVTSSPGERAPTGSRDIARTSEAIWTIRT